MSHAVASNTSVTYNRNCALETEVHGGIGPARGEPARVRRRPAHHHGVGLIGRVPEGLADLLLEDDLHLIHGAALVARRHDLLEEAVAVWARAIHDRQP